VNTETLIRFLVALGVVDPERFPPNRRRPSHSRRTATASLMGGGRGCARPRKPSNPPRHALQRPPRDRGRRRDGGFLPPHPLEPGLKPIIGTAYAMRSPMPGSRRANIRLHQRPRHRHAGERQMEISRSLGTVSASASKRADLLEQVDDRPHLVGPPALSEAVFHAAHPRSTSDIPPTINYRRRTRRSRWTWCRTSRATQACVMRSRTFLRLW